MGADVHLNLPCHASSVREARLAVAALARRAGMPDERIEDLRLAVSEAATNAIQHGVDGSGDVSVNASVAQGELRVWITDKGGGMRPRPDSPGLGLGLPIIASLTDHLEIVTDDEGTTVEMTFVCG
ncbi:MAG TPA: ATP-binding protein [Solirubrobacteraceae bacterium]|jgi:serine/threonine-protein kinase RsbW